MLRVDPGIYGGSVTKTLIDIDDGALDLARRALGTSTKKDTVNQALAAVAALSARRRDLERFAADLHADLRDADIMSSAWQR
jgi:Arc/MetJ family transcription regulator